LGGRVSYRLGGGCDCATNRLSRKQKFASGPLLEPEIWL